MIGKGREALYYFQERAQKYWDPSNAAKLQTFIDDPENTLPSTTKLIVVEGGTSDDRKELCYSLRNKLDGLHTVIVIVSGEAHTVCHKRACRYREEHRRDLRDSRKPVGRSRLYYPSRQFHGCRVYIAPRPVRYRIQKTLLCEGSG